ncbi:MAG: hypothetical protein MI807_10815, partial [Verrucomicrobiales bacterium]|nr:hypothetical protein [Verrucomicrobiales bacterium]
IDEMSHLHEHLDFILTYRYETTGVFHWPWIIPYGILVIVTGVVLFKFFLRIPTATKIFFVSAALIYVGGAIGMETQSAVYVEGNNESESGMPYYILVTIEESMEMIGVIVVIFGLFHYIANRWENFAFTVHVLREISGDSRQSTSSQ